MFLKCLTRGINELKLILIWSTFILWFILDHCTLSEHAKRTDFEDQTGYNKNNNFDNRRISRICALGAQKNCLIETQLRENNQNLGLDAYKDPLIETVLFSTQIVCFRWNKRKVTSPKAHVGPSKARQRYAISMAYRWWAIDGPTLCASLVETLWQ